MSIKILKDLRSQFGEIRDQGPRPTCVAFAASDCHSFANNELSPMSVEYAFYHAVQRTIAKDRQKGVSFENISEAILLDGQPAEEGWKYLVNLKDSDPWNPPDDPGLLFKHKSKKASSDLLDVYTSIDNGHPLILVTDISMSFYTLKGTSILKAPQNETRRGTHAIIAVGYGNCEGSKFILVRNSWGTGWAEQGYGLIDEEYLKTRLHLTAVMN